MLWRAKSQLDRSFGFLWFGHSVSELGNQVTLFVVPTIAVLTLHASPLSVALLGVAQFVAYPLFGLHAGSVADRSSRRWVMIVTDVARMLLVAVIPLAAMLFDLRLWLLLLVTVAVGAMAVYFDVAAQALVPDLVSGDQLTSANARLSLSSSAALMLGPTLGGVIIELMYPPNALWIDAATFAVSAGATLALGRGLRRVPSRVSVGAPTDARGGWREGLNFIWRARTLRSITLCTATSNLGLQIVQANYYVYAYRVLHVSAGVVGVIFAVGAAVGMASAAASGIILRRFQTAPVLMSTSVVAGVSWLFAAQGKHVNPIMALAAACVVLSAALPLYNIAQLSYRQRLAPRDMQARVHAASRTVTWATIPIGYLVGGLLGDFASPLTGVYVGGVVSVAAAAWLVIGRAEFSAPLPELSAAEAVDTEAITGQATAAETTAG
jgi:MFS family permease